MFGFTDKNKEVLEKYIKLWNETINGYEFIEYKKDLMKIIRFKLDDALLLGKLLSIPSMIIVTRFVFQEGSKYYQKVCLHECVYEVLDEL